jgi:hypothetical protein
MTEKSRNDHDPTRANWILFAILAALAVALYAGMFFDPPNFSH